MKAFFPLLTLSPLTLLCGALIVGCDTTSPPVDAGLSQPEGAVLSGDVVVLVPLEEAHPVVLFLTRIDVGEDGEPSYTTINLTVVPASELTQGDDAGHGRVGSYVFSPVPEGDYVLTGIVDVDENFNPFVTLEADPDPDLQGGYANLSTGSPVFHLDAGQQATEINVYFTTPASPPAPTPSAEPPTSSPTPSAAATATPAPTLAPTAAPPTQPSPSATPSPTFTPTPTEATPTGGDIVAGTPPTPTP